MVIIMKLFHFILIIIYFTLTACSAGMPNNIAVGIGGGNHNFGLGTTFNVPLNNKKIPSEPPPIAGTEKKPTTENKPQLTNQTKSKIHNRLRKPLNQHGI